MTLHITTKQEQEHYWAKRTIDVYKGKLEIAYRCGNIPVKKLRIMAGENEEAAELLRKIEQKLVTTDLMDDNGESEERDEREEQIAWDEILYWDDNRKHH